MLDSPPTNHTINVLAAGVPIVSLWARAPEIITIVAGCLGIIWYSILILEKVMSWLDKDGNDPLK